MDINIHLLWFFYFVASISITHLVVGGSIFGPIRAKIINSESNWIHKLKISDLIMCYQCSGFWVGIITAPIWLIQIYSINIIKSHWVELFIFIFAFGTVISLLSDLFYRIKQYLCDQCG